MKKLSILFFSLFFISISSQVNVKYQKPSKEILNHVEFERHPSILYDENKNCLYLINDRFGHYRTFYLIDKKNKQFICSRVPHL